MEQGQSLLERRKSSNEVDAAGTKTAKLLVELVR